MNTKRIFTWIVFIVIIGLIIWGLIAANKKSSQENDSLLSPNEIVSTDHIKGNPMASTTLLEYGDFQCPACAVYHPLVEQLVNESSTTLRFVFRHFPLSQHANAISAAHASEAASKQGKFWEMYDMIYSTQKNWESSTNAKTIFAGYAEKLGLDMGKYGVDVDSKEVDDIVTNDYKSGIKINVRGTPTFFLNGEAIETPQSYDEFKKIIEDVSK